MNPKERDSRASERAHTAEEAYLHLLQNQLSSIVNSLQNPMEGIPKMFRGISSAEIENSLRSADAKNLPPLQIVDSQPRTKFNTPAWQPFE